MKRVAALLVASSILLTGCGEKVKDHSEITIAGEFGEMPKLDSVTNFVTDKTRVRVLKEGDGEDVTKGRMVALNSAFFDGKTGKAVQNTFAGTPKNYTVDDTLEDFFLDAIVGKKAGTRLLITGPTPQPPGSDGATPDPTTTNGRIVVVDVVKVFDARATGEDQEVDKDAPKVELDDKGAPTITIPDGEPPKELKTYVLKKGKGAEVKAKQNLLVQYRGVNWRTKKEFDSSWKRKKPAEFPIGDGKVIKGWDEGLVGQTVGSQILLVIPPKDGYGKQGSPSSGIKGDDTLVFVVDILDAN